MDFVIGLPRSRDGYDSIWMIVDRLTKSAHFLPVKTTYFVVKLAKLYVKHIVCLYRVPISIVSDRGSVSPLAFGRSCKKQWAPDLISVLLSILRQMVNLSERSKHLKIC